jgi:hypothetical protein
VLTNFTTGFYGTLVSTLPAVSGGAWRGRCASIFLDKNRRSIGQSQSERSHARWPCACVQDYVFFSTASLRRRATLRLPVRALDPDEPPKHWLRLPYVSAHFTLGSDLARLATPPRWGTSERALTNLRAVPVLLGAMNAATTSPAGVDGTPLGAPPPPGAVVGTVASGWTIVIGVSTRDGLRFTYYVLRCRCAPAEAAAAAQLLAVAPSPLPSDLLPPPPWRRSHAGAAPLGPPTPAGHLRAAAAPQAAAAAGAPHRSSG